MYSEEAILSKQVISKGKKELYVNEVTSYHEHYEKDKKPTSMRMQKFIKSREYYINSYSGYNNFIKILITFSLRSQALYWRLKG